MPDDISWKKISIEGLVIVISILLAFAIEAYWQERQNQIEERELIINLRQDLLENQQRIVAQVATLETAEESLSEFLSLQPQSSQQSQGEVSFERILSPILRTYTNSGLVSGFLDSTTNSGLLVQISLPEIRTALAEIETRELDLSIIADDIRALTDQLLVELGRTPDVLMRSRDIEGTVYFDGIGLELINDLLSNSQLMALSRAKLSRFGSYRTNFNGLQRELQAAIDIINTELDS